LHSILLDANLPQKGKRAGELGTSSVPEFGCWLINPLCGIFCYYFRVDKNSRMNIVPCWFCEKELPDSGSALHQSLYSIVERRNAVVVRQVKYSVLKVDVPRCARCAKLHRWARIAARTPLIIGCVIGLPFAVPGLIVVGGTGFLVGYGIKTWILRGNRIKPRSRTSLSKHPLLIDQLAAGWKLEKPRA
jgi:hypothetical protein